MKYRLDEDHYINDRILPAGTEVGDGCDEPFRFATAKPGYKDFASGQVYDAITAGQPMVPSRSMTPLDKEAEAQWDKKFGDGKPLPPKDPTHAIPIRGTQDTAKTPPTPRQQPPASTPAKPPVTMPHSATAAQQKPEPPKNVVTGGDAVVNDPKQNQTTKED